MKCGEVESMWDCVIPDLQDLDKLLRSAIKNFGDQDKSLSATTRKRLAAKSLQGLIAWQDNLDKMLGTLLVLKEVNQQWESYSTAARESKESTTNQLEEVLSDFQSATVSLRTEQAEKNAALRDLSEVQIKLDSATKLNEVLSHKLQTREDDLKDLSEEAEAARTSVQEMEVKLQQQAEQLDCTSAEAQKALTMVDGLRDDATNAKALAKRQQEVVAKLTADNLMFMMKLKQTEEKLAATAHERDLLKMAVEQQKGPWFDEVRCGVETRVKEAMCTAQHLEEQLKQERSSHQQCMSEASLLNSELESRLCEVKEQLSALRMMKVSAEEKAEKCSQERKLMEESCQAMKNTCKDLESENRAMAESLRCIREENCRIWTKEQHYLETVKSLEEKLAVCSQAQAALERQLANEKDKLDAQIAVNREVMRRKESIEWELMEMQAKTAQAISSSDSGTDRPHTIQPNVTEAEDRYQPLGINLEKQQHDNSLKEKSLQSLDGSTICEAQGKCAVNEVSRQDENKASITHYNSLLIRQP